MGSLLTGGVVFLVSWFTILRNTPSRNEIYRILEHQSPWVQDRGAVITRLDILEQSYERLGDKHDNILVIVNEIKSNQAAFKANMEQLLNAVQDLRDNHGR